MKLYKLILRSWNVTTTIKVELSPSEAKLMRDINKSLVDQKAQVVLSIEEVKNG